jgi:hypothetical protein
LLVACFFPASVLVMNLLQRVVGLLLLGLNVASTSGNPPPLSSRRESDLRAYLEDVFGSANGAVTVYDVANGLRAIGEPRKPLYRVMNAREHKRQRGLDCAQAFYHSQDFHYVADCASAWAVEVLRLQPSRTLDPVDFAEGQPSHCMFSLECRERERAAPPLIQSCAHCVNDQCFTISTRSLEAPRMCHLPRSARSIATT